MLMARWRTGSIRRDVYKRQRLTGERMQCRVFCLDMLRDIQSALAAGDAAKKQEKKEKSCDKFMVCHDMQEIIKRSCYRVATTPFCIDQGISKVLPPM